MKSETGNRITAIYSTVKTTAMSVVTLDITSALWNGLFWTGQPTAVKCFDAILSRQLP